MDGANRPHSWNYKIERKKMAKKNVRVKVRYHTCLKEYDFAIYAGRNCIMCCYGNSNWWKTKEGANRNAKKMAKLIGIPYDPKIIKLHGC